MSASRGAADTLAKIVMWIGALAIVLPILLVMAFGLAMIIIGLGVA